MKNVVIIGAGPAGLTAAYRLLKNSEDFHPIIVEESEFIGGISRTDRYKGNRIDIGGHRFFSKDNQIMKMWEEILPLQGASSKDDLIWEEAAPLKARPTPIRRKPTLFFSQEQGFQGFITGGNFSIIRFL